MSFLPENTYLGNLEIIETYVFYDIPVLFVARNLSGQLYLVQMEDDGDEVTTWLYVPMSKNRFEHVRSGAIDLYSAFTLAEDGVVYEVQMDVVDDRVTAFSMLPASEISQDRLPLKGASLSLHTPTAVLAEPKEYSLRAIQTQREILQLELFFPGQRRTEAPAKPLGEILSNLQNVISAIGSSTSSSRSPSRQQTREMRRESEVVVVGLKAASFNVELASATTVDLFGYSRVGDAIDKLLTIIEVGGVENTLKDHLNQFESTVASGYLKLLVSFDESSIDRAQLTWDSPVQGKGRSQNISMPTVVRTIEILKTWQEVSTKIIEVTGVLIGLNRRTKTFEIKKGSQTFKGAIDSDITVETFEAIAHSSISEIYRAKLREITTTRVAVSDTETSYRLLELSTPR